MDTAKYTHGVYAVIDNITKEILGGLHLHKHEAAAIRFFTDVATLPNSMIAQHPNDYALWRLGYITLEQTLEAHHELIITGGTLAATQPQTP